MDYILKILFEGWIVGKTTLLVGIIISYIYAKMTDNNTKFLNNKGMYICLFLTGFVLHISWDLVGLNKWYCNNCAGCK